MPEPSKSYTFVNQDTSADCAITECAAYDAYKNFHRDPSGYYVLLKVNFEHYRIEVALCNKNHSIEAIFHGRSSQDLYYSILHYEKSNQLNWFNEKTHIAYLGKELKKAEIALSTGQNSYFQE